MKKIKLTESQVSNLLNEASYDTIKRIYYSDIKNLKSGKGTLDGTTIRGIANALYDAIKGTGTDNDAITDNLNKCKNLHDFKNVRNKFYSMYNERLLTWLDDDIDGDGEWTTTVLRPLQRIYDASKAAGHFKEVVQDETEKNIISKFPCLGDTPGYKFERAKDGILYFKVNSDDYAVKEDGTLMKHDGSQWNTFPEKTKCIGAKYQDVSEQDINEQGLDLNPGGEKQTTTTPDTSTGDTKTDTETKTADTENTPDEKPKVVTRLMTGNDVKEIQTILHKQGFGDIVGSVDGKLGPKTLAGIKKLFLGVTRPKIEAITLQPKGIKSIETKIETPKLALAEDIQKNFKRFL